MSFSARWNSIPNAKMDVHKDYEMAKLQARLKSLEYENKMIMGLLSRVLTNRGTHQDQSVKGQSSDYR